MNNDELDMKMDTRSLILPWKGWSWHDCYLQSPEGVRFSPDMVRSSFFAYELARELTASPLQVYSLSRELKKRLASLQTSSPEVVIRWNGQETVVKLPAFSGSSK